MSVTYGFYNSKNGDRKYNAEHFSSIFKGIITDGIFEKIGDAFQVTAASGFMVNVGTGRCWFDGTWTDNDAPLPITCENSSLVGSRIDAVVIEVDKSEANRRNTIKCVKGATSDNPVKPELIKTDDVNQYAICYINIPKGSTEITQADIIDVRFIEHMIIRGALDTIDARDSFLQWSAELDEFIKKEKADMDVALSEMNKTMEESIAELKTWLKDKNDYVDYWFDRTKDLLSADAALSLQIQIDEDEIERILVSGLTSGTKTISADGSKITTTDSNGMILHKQFTNDFSKCIIILTNSKNVQLGKLVKTYSSDGATISSELTIF